MRLLLAEDEVELSRALKTILEHNHYSVDAVFDGQDAYDYLVNGNYDGAILDIMMPKMDGVTVVKKVREEGLNTPILMLTAKAEIDDRVVGLDAGADDYLTKPFATKELMARIRSMTRRLGDTTDSTLKLGDLSLDRTTCQVVGPKGSLHLANKEFQMLEMLMVKPGQVVSTDLFMDKIWGFESDAEQNVVWVYISYLRKKLASLGTCAIIKASRGLGYYMEVPHD